MTGDKLKRVQAVRKWLEKAEQSFTLHRDISGEWNLIMAQAEMQRLRETDRAGRRRRLWGSRVLALAAAAALFSGYSLWQSYREEPVPIPAVVPAEQTAAAPEPARESPPRKPRRFPRRFPQPGPKLCRQSRRRLRRPLRRHLLPRCLNGRFRALWEKRDGRFADNPDAPEAESVV